MDVMRLRRMADFDLLREPWRALAAGIPMRDWHWQSTWWAHYGHAIGGSKRELFVLAVTDGPRVVAIAPWLIDQVTGRGRVIRFLGEEEVCSDYPTILCGAEDRTAAAAALADYLADEFSAWDVLELAGIDAHDAVVNDLVACLAERGFFKFNRDVAFRCWRLALPPSWDEYVQSLSKSYRKQLRWLQRDVFDAGRGVAKHVTEAAQFESAWEVLVDLHQRRRRSKGEPGCFASRKFTAFHYSVAQRLLAAGQLGLMWVELEGRPISAEYNLFDTHTLYAYQSGVDPNYLAEQPGRLSTMNVIQRSIEEGRTTLDFLRGDEPYKAHWRAQPVEMFTIRVVAERRVAQLREAAFQAVDSFKDWLKGNWRRVRDAAPGAYAS